MAGAGGSGAIYLALLPFSVRSFRRLRRAAEEMLEAAEE